MQFIYPAGQGISAIASLGLEQNRWRYTGVSSTAEDCGVPSNNDSLEKALTSTTQLPNSNTTIDALSLSISHLMGQM